MNVIQLSDIHLMKDPNGKLGGINTQAHLEKILVHINQGKKLPDLSIMSGDLSQDGSAESYQRLASTMIKVNCPVYWLPGNHDDLENAKQYLRGKNIIAKRTFVSDNWQIILLDSTAPGLDDGFISSLEFKLLQKSFKKYPHHHILIALHHQPMAINCAYMDTIRLINEEKFLSSIIHVSPIKAVIFGHVHQVFAQRIGKIKFLSAPATSIQFKPTSKKFAIDKALAPGYRWLQLTNNGKVRTEIIRIKQPIEN